MEENILEASCAFPPPYFPYFYLEKVGYFINECNKQVDLAPTATFLRV